MDINKKSDVTFDNETVINERPGFGHRHIQALLMFFVVFIAYFIRISMSVAILAMVDTKNVNNSGIQVYDWDKQSQDMILSAFFWGYSIMPIFAGVMGLHFGPWLLLGIALATNGLSCLILPLLVPYGGWIMLCFLRMLVGVTQGFVFPSIHTLIGRWFPLEERGRLLSFVYSGLFFGSAVSLQLAGLLAASPMGWPGIFYISGATSLAIGIFWIWLGSNSPDTHRKISAKERNYINLSLSVNSSSVDESRPKKTPIKEMVKSAPVWALMVTQIGWNFGYILLLLQTPSYMTNVLGIDLKMTGFLSGFSQFAAMFSGYIASALNIFFVSRKIFSNAASTKVWTTFCLWGQCALYMILSFLSPDFTATGVTLLIAITGINGIVPISFMTNHIELGPNYGGVLLGAGTTLSNFIGIAGPMASGLILNKQEHDPLRWRIIFLFIAAVYFVSNGIFLWFGTSNEQSWNQPKTEYIAVETTEKEKHKNSTDKLNMVNDDLKA